MSTITLRWTVLLISIAGAGCTAPVPPFAARAVVDTLVPPSARDPRRIGALAQAPDGSVLASERSGSIVRIRGRERTLAAVPTAHTRDVVAIGWLSDTLLLVDQATASATLFLPDGRPVRELALGRRFRSASVDVRHRQVYLAVYGERYRYENARFVVGEDSLVDLRSLNDGGLVRELGSPREHGDDHLSILGNHVSLATDALAGEVWMGWPMEPEVTRLLPPRGGQSFGYYLGFAPDAPREIPYGFSSLPVPDFQQVTYGIAVDPEGRILILAAAGPKRSPTRSRRYVPPPQVVSVQTAAGKPLCRVALPFYADVIAAGASGEILLSAATRAGGAYRVRYACPAVV